VGCACRPLNQPAVGDGTFDLAAVTKAVAALLNMFTEFVTSVAKGSRPGVNSCQTVVTNFSICKKNLAACARTSTARIV